LVAVNGLVYGNIVNNDLDERLTRDETTTLEVATDDDGLTNIETTTLKVATDDDGLINIETTTLKVDTDDDGLTNIETTTLKVATNDDHSKIKNPKDCADIYMNKKSEGQKVKSDIYEIWPAEGKSIKVYCDMDTDGGGWTVFQRRDDFPRQENFYRTWADYKEGFGDLQREFWLGNDYLSLLTNQDIYSLRFDLEDFNKDKRVALYYGFRIANATDKYRMTVESFIKGDAGDSFTDHSGMQFSTKDQDNDISKDEACANIFKGAWWYKACHASNLNGLYLRGDHPKVYAQGVIWKTFRDYYYSLKKSEMKIRPVTFKN
jgi:hypothetical protein